MANWATQQEVADYLGVALASAPPATLVAAAQEAILAYIGRPVASAERTEYYSGIAGSPYIRLNVWPVISVAHVYNDPNLNYGENTSITDPAELTLGLDYVIVRESVAGGKAGLLEYIMGGTGPGALTSPPGPSYFARGMTTAARAASFSWPVGQGNIKVVYTAGYATIPEDLKIAEAYQAQWMKRIGRNAGQNLVSESWGQYSYTQASGPPLGNKVVGPVGILSPQVAQMVNKYRDVPLGQVL